MRIERNDELAASYVQQFLGLDVRGSPFAGLLVVTDRGVAGCIVLNDYANNNIEMTGVGRGCWSVSVIRTLARFIFRDLNCNRVTARTAQSNHEARTALRKLGFRREGRVREWFGHEDAILYGLLRREQRIVR